MSDEPAVPPRAGRKRGRQTLTNEELHERIDFTAKMLARRLYKSDVKRVLKTKYHVSTRTCDEYISRARATLVEWTGRDLAEHRVDSLAYYEAVLRSTTDEDRGMRAQARIDKILGIEAPQQHEVKATVKVEEQRAKLGGVLEALRRRAESGQGN
jgi:hypothetical protein